jgi:hypothetical protein
MKNLKYFMASLCLSIVCMGCLDTANTTYFFYSDLSAVAGVTTSGTGRIDASATRAASEIPVTGFYNNLSSPATNVTVKSPNRTCSTPVIAITQKVGDPNSGTLFGNCFGSYTQADLDNFNAGLFTVTISTTSHPNGELQGVLRR